MLRLLCRVCVRRQISASLSVFGVVGVSHTKNTVQATCSELPSAYG